MVPFFIVMGLLGGTYHAPASSFISQIMPRNKRGKALGMHFVGGSASFLLTPAVALGLASLLNSWRSSFFILALPAMLVGIILWLTTEEPQDDVDDEIDETKGSDQKTNHKNPPGTTQQDQLSWVQITRSIGILASLAIMLNIAFASVNSFLPLYMVDHHHVSPKWAGIVISIIAGSGIVGAPLGGSLSDRLGRKTLIFFSVSLSGPLFFAVTRFPLGIPLLLSLVFYGMAMSVRGPTIESLIADVVPIGRRTTVLAVYFFLGMETAGVTTPLVGRLIDGYGLDPVFTGLAAGLCGVAAVVLFFRKRI
jgi:FSR family fosmidomycin resistance protein-like MFS transporter